MPDITPEAPKAQSPPSGPQPALIATDADKLVARIRRESLRRGLIVATIFLVLHVGAAVGIVGVVFACNVIWPAMLSFGVAGYVVRAIGFGESRRFGIAGAVLAVLGCVVVELTMPLVVLANQTDRPLTDIDDFGQVLRLLRGHCRFTDLFPIAGAGLLGYVFGSKRPSSHASLRASRHSSWKALVIIAGVVGALVAFLVFNGWRTRVRQVKASPDGKFVAVNEGLPGLLGGDSPTVWDQAGKPHVSLPHQGIKRMDWAPGGQVLAVLASSGDDKKPQPDVHLLSMRLKKKVADLGTEPGRSIDCLAFSPFGLEFVVGHRRLDFWSLLGPVPLFSIDLPEGATHLAFSPNGGTLLVALRDGSLVLCDVVQRELVRSWASGQGRISGLAFNGDTASSAAALAGTVKAWDVRTMAEKWSTPLPMDWLTDLALSRDGTTLAVAGGSFHRSGEVRLLNTATGQEMQRFTVPVNTVRAVCFTPDGKVLIAGTTASISPFRRERNGRVHRWDIATGQELPPLP
jgi:WD40 repeat protein